MVADELDYVVGVDTHLDEHVLAIIAAPSGAVVARRSIEASARGYAAALRFAAAEAIGSHVSILVPADRHPEVDEILRRIRAGDRVDHHETIRQRKDGSLLQATPITP